MWPRTKTNTLINVCRNGSTIIVERFGKFTKIQQPGLFVAIPLVDKLSYVVDSRETTISIKPQRTISKDNVQIDVSGNVFMRFTDPYKAAYGSLDPFYSVKQHAQSAMRSAIGNMELDELLHNRTTINNSIHRSLEKASFDWGIEITRYELTEISPNNHIRDSLDKQASAERARREQILSAEGDKRSDILRSEGYRQKVINQAEADAQAVRLKAQADVDGMKMITDYINNNPNYKDTVFIQCIKDTIKMYGEIGSKSNTLIFGNRPGAIDSVMKEAILLNKFLEVDEEKEEKN